MGEWLRGVFGEIIFSDYVAECAEFFFAKRAISGVVFRKHLILKESVWKGRSLHLSVY